MNAKSLKKTEKEIVKDLSKVSILKKPKSARPTQIARKRVTRLVNAANPQFRPHNRLESPRKLVSTGGAGTTTVNGRNWLHKILDPANQSNGTCYGVPDASGTQVVTPQEREIFKINLPLSGFKSSAPLTPVNFNPDLVYNLIVVNSPVALTTFWMAYQGALGVQDCVYQFGALPYKLKEHANGVVKARLMFFGSTLQFTGASIKDQGEAVHSQLPHKYLPESIGLPDTGVAGSLVPHPSLNYRVWPLTSAQYNGSSLNLNGPSSLDTWVSNLAEMDPSCLLGKAKDGAYFPHKITDPNFFFMEVIPYTYNDSASLTSGCMLVNPFALFFFKSSDLPKNIDNRITFDFLFDEPFNFNASVSHFMGIDPVSTFELKIYLGLEAAVGFDSPLQYYTHKAIELDSCAIALHKEISSRMGSAYPSRMNFWGTLKNVIAHIVKSSVPGLSGMVPIFGKFLEPLVKQGVDMFL